ncbi:SDR family NAD(P)-dependent oxidoreductase [Amycolatopsis sp. cmx-11-51]|uniref:SDR family NAD(P)-dependent oxidoreductase n=1 Tax=unclassified Amycolatopsis TaxID=2618356 RepID=UPI0039E23B2E
MTSWGVRHPPRAEGKTFLVTGGNAGIGYFTAEQLAGSGATVLLGSRNAAKAAAAMTSIRSRVPDTSLGHLRLDLSDLASLKSSVDTLEIERLDAVVCNAGVLLENQPRRETADGHELTFATNHLGHFVLVHHLMPLLEAAEAGRVVTTGSFVGKSAKLDLDDLQSKRDYQPKRAAGSTALSVVNHPGGALDSLTPPRPVHAAPSGRKFPAGLLLHGKEAGAWPAVRAVLDPDVRGGEMFGPRVFGLRGEPRLEPVRGKLADTALAARLWAASVGLIGVEVTR